MASAHARDHRYAVRAGFDAAGRLTAMDVRADCNAGAYSVYPWTAGIEAPMAGGLLTGPYKLDHYRCEVAALATNTTPAGPYRGVARPATTFVMERVLDLAARELGLDPVEIRRVNLVGPGDLPYTSPTRLVHDSPSYPVCFEKVVEAIGYGAFRAQQARAARRGALRRHRLRELQRADGPRAGGLGGAAHALPDRPRGRDRPDGSVGRGDRARRRDVAGAGDRDHRRADRRLRAGAGLRGGDRRARGYRRDAVRPRRLRLAPGGHRRWRRHARRAGRARQGRAHRRASARGRPGRPRARRWADRGEGCAGAGRVDARRGARRPPRDQSPARRPRAGARGHAVLRSDPRHLRRRRAGRRGRGRSRHGNDRDPPLRVRRGYRARHQSAHRRRTGPGRDRPGNRRRPDRASRLRRRGPAPDRHVHGVRAADGGLDAGGRSRSHRGARGQPHRRARRRRGRHARSRGGSRQRGRRRAGPARRRGERAAPHARPPLDRLRRSPATRACVDTGDGGRVPSRQSRPHEASPWYWCSSGSS